MEKNKIKVNGKKMIAIIDYKAGNLKSVERALKKARGKVNE